MDMSKSMGENLSAAMLDSRYFANTYQWYYDLFAFVYENRETIQLMIQAKARQKARQMFLPVLHDIFQADSEEKYYQIIAYEGGLNNMIVEWFETGMKKDIAQMAKLCDEFYGAFHRKLLLQSRRKDRVE